ncbi:MAG TPA: prepilin peptidase, partial [candidate division Zixibacteria bacterium]|nr:prepilin peptidase [candidate division Zixibacteria bacterium]
MNTLILIWIGAVGLAIGSFLNVVIYRLPLKKRFGLGRSICPKCGTQLRWYHNIPLASWAALRGKCAFCRQPISWRYPLVELMTAGAYVYFWAYLGFSPMFFVWAALVSALIVIIFVDLDHQIIPDSITLSGMAAGLAASFLPNGLGIVQSLIGLVVGGGSL